MFRTLYSVDAARAFICALKSASAANRTYHIAMQEIMTTERWAGLLWSAAGHECTVTHVPMEVVHRQRALKDYAPPLSRPIPYIQDLSKAERDFGFTTTRVEDWVQTTVDWYGERYEGGDSKGYEYRSEELALAAKWTDRLAELVSGF